jgi:hypothetical protein
MIGFKLKSPISWGCLCSALSVQQYIPKFIVLVDLETVFSLYLFIYLHVSDFHTKVKLNLENKREILPL